MIEREPGEPIDEPPRLDEVAAAFPVRLVELEPQPRARELPIPGTRSGWNDGVLADQAVLITYAVLRASDDPDDPANRTDLPPGLADALLHPGPLPERLREAIGWMRFPLAMEAVQTLVPRGHRPLAEALEEHMVNRLMNDFREERMLASIIPDGRIEIASPPAAADAVAATLLVDGAEVPGIRIDDEHLLALGTLLDDCMLTVVLPKHLAASLRIAFRRRPR